MTHGPHGVRLANDEAGRKGGPATSFPTGVSMASSWDLELVERVGNALAEETLAMGCNILFRTLRRIVRHPLVVVTSRVIQKTPTWQVASAWPA